MSSGVERRGELLVARSGREQNEAEQNTTLTTTCAPTAGAAQKSNPSESQLSAAKPPTATFAASERKRHQRCGLRFHNRADAIRSVAVAVTCDSFFTWTPSGRLGVNRKRDTAEMHRRRPGSGEWLSFASKGGKVIDAKLGTAPAQSRCSPLRETVSCQGLRLRTGPWTGGSTSRATRC